MHDDVTYRVALRYEIRRAAHEIASGHSFQTRTASLRDVTPEVLTAFGEGFLMQGSAKEAFFGNIKRRLQKVWDFLKRAPKAWETLKKHLGVKDVSELPGKIKQMAKEGIKALGKVISKLKNVFPFSMYFVPKGKLPGLTDLLQRIVDASPALKKALSRVNDSIVQPLDRILQKYLPNLSRPLKAAIFIWIWLNVAEISWDFSSLIAGFTGGISLGELFGSLPESAIGAVLASLGVGFHLLPVMLVARILWLVAQNYLEWVPGKGLKVRWDRITGERMPPEMVPAV